MKPRRRPPADETPNTQQRIAWNLARRHVAGEEARADFAALFAELLQGKIQPPRTAPAHRVSEVQAPFEPANQAAMAHAVTEIWDALVATHATLELLEPIAATLQSTGEPRDRSLIDAVARVLEEREGPAKSAFLTRSLTAVAQLASQLDEKSLGRAAGAASSFGVLVQALEQPEAATASSDDDPLAAARIRGLGIRDRLLHERGGALSVDQVATVLGLTRQGVDKRRKAGRLLALSTGRRGYAYPAWQFQSGAVLPGVEEALAALAVLDPWLQATFFLSPAAGLADRAPLDALERGEIELVIREARLYGDQAAA